MYVVFAVNSSEVIKNRTERRDIPYAATIVELRKRLAVEYHLYNFIRQRFINLKSQLEKFCDELH